MRKKPFHLPQQFGLLLGSILGVFVVTIFLKASPGQAAHFAQDEYETLYVIPDGVWVGAFSGSDAISIGGAYAEAYFKGKLNLEVVGGELSGIFKATGSSSSESQDGYGIATFSSKGTLGGRAREPWMQTSSTVFDYAIHAQGYLSEFEVEMSSGFPMVELTLTESANCNSMSGNFDSSVTQSIEETGTNVLSVQTEFTITRISGIADKAPEVYQEELAALMEEADKLISETLKNQTLDTASLMVVILKATDLNSGIYYDNLCSHGTASNKFNTAIVGIIAKLINLAYAHPDWFTAQHLNFIAFAAYTTGAIGAGSPNEELAIELTNKLEKITDNLLQQVEQSQKPDCDIINALYTVAMMLGTESLLPETTDAMNKYQCGGS